MTAASIRVRGVVQGVGFRPFVYRLARAHALSGWVANEESGVDIHLEGEASSLDAFLLQLKEQSPAASRISAIEIRPAERVGLTNFSIEESRAGSLPSVRICPDLPVCEECLREMNDPANRRYRYPYINCVNCGPRYTIMRGLPYDRVSTTMAAWDMEEACRREYNDPADRRFHAQPVACGDCGPHYRISIDGGASGELSDWPAITRAADCLRAGSIVAIKGIGGYHLACDAVNAAAVTRLRERKFRKEKPFAVMVQSIELAREIVVLDFDSAQLLTSPPRPIVLAAARAELPGVAPDNTEIGVMLPYAPLHHLLFEAGAPHSLVMTSANHSNQPIAFRDEDAFERLTGIADSFLIGDRPIARRVDDSVVRGTPFGPMILRRSRGYAPSAVTLLPVSRPILAVGADLKNAVTLVINGQAFVSQHIGDLAELESLEAFRETIADLCAMYEVHPNRMIVAHDAHPGYVSTAYAADACACALVGVQHHRAHVASVLAERQAWDKRVLGITFDGTGYGDDGAIWGGEFFVGSIAEGFERVLHLRSAVLAGGDAAARWPVQAAAGFLSQLRYTLALHDAPFQFPNRYELAVQMVRKQLRVFRTTSVGRLFDTAAALLGFTREISFEGQAAIWLEQSARWQAAAEAYPFPSDGAELDFRLLLECVIDDRLRGRPVAFIARAFHRGVAQGICNAAARLCEEHKLDTVVLSGGVFQNALLLEDVRQLQPNSLKFWTNRAVPPNDGGISLGQAAIAAFSGAKDA